MSDICAKATSSLFLGMEFGVKSMPGVIFLFLGTYRYCSIRHMAKASVVYSRLFKAKVGISGSMAVVTFVYMLTVFLTPKDSVASSWINQCDKQWYAWIYLIQCAAWSFGTFLLTREYHRLIDEAVYANYTFWMLNLLAETLVIIVLRDAIFASLFMTITAIFNASVNLTLMALACQTTRQNTKYRTPLIMDFPDMSTTLIKSTSNELGFRVRF